MIDLEESLAWLASFGGTDDSYFRAHFGRFVDTKAFCERDAPLPAGSKILDVGAHWLHQTIFYALDGHRVACVDAPNTLREASVQRLAEAIGATLHVADILERGDGIAQLPDSSIDVVLFSEIIEHLAFNPIPMWKEIYRCLKPGGRIIVTTPNGRYWRSSLDQFFRLTQSGSIGIRVDGIFSAGTFGHHWKEFTSAEVREYFAILSPDFVVSGVEYNQLDSEEPPAVYRDHFGVVEEERFVGMFIEVLVPEKRAGISIEPPWVPVFPAPAQSSSN
jgi:2-polyprenyl-6-hydroxyphenyl methylase/3-demethylubiquinone-9 3-methyltransferase